ncbi:hypothetical protein QTA58_00250 [Neorhizobium sp. CSC1952]|uniref:hypothetical protein n=1 Tax=Neorhizobium sp. CSC1952 TaxID=2978974 RepID=UPI0025A56A1F|nr:hypothetical protein [Rhizobium sp. CSC1952]WJR67240.1 hypothetical protein QTA58_00250 [Rhizobium sp. CSC1952]
MNELDEIMSGTGEAMPAAQQEQKNDQPRDDIGRFAAKQEEQPAVVEEPVVAEQQPVQEEQHDKGGIPPARLKAEAEKRREAEAANEALRRELAELRGMVMAQRQPAPQPQQEQPPASLWDDPDAYLKSQLTPVQQQMQETREMLWELQAAQLHGAEKLAAAKEAANALSGTQQGRALHQQIMAGGNPYDNLVKWHTQNQLMQRIGNDPDAWLNAEIERRLSDPAEQAKIMERIRGTASANTNRSQPVTNLPPSLSRLPAGGNTPADNDVSDGALFNFATR